MKHVPSRSSSAPQVPHVGPGNAGSGNLLVRLARTRGQQPWATKISSLLSFISSFVGSFRGSFYSLGGVVDPS
jgi:hypothetical protein